MDEQPSSTPEGAPSAPATEKPKRRKRRPRAAVLVLPQPPPSPSRSVFRAMWGLQAVAYLAVVWLDGIGSNVPAKLVPRPYLFFAQVAALFVTAAPKVIDYRAEGWSCSEHRWIEVDVRPYFRIDEDNKENRFQRALQFYRRSRTVMRALDDYVVERYDATNTSRIGGVRFSSLRIAYPGPGKHITPFQHLPLAAYSGEQRHDWYWTPKSRRAERCGQRPDPADGTDDARDPDPTNSPAKTPGPRDSEPRESDP